MLDGGVHCSHQPQGARQVYISCCVNLLLPRMLRAMLVKETVINNDDVCEGEYACGDNNCEDGDARMDSCECVS